MAWVVKVNAPVPIVFDVVEVPVNLEAACVALAAEAFWLTRAAAALAADAVAELDEAVACVVAIPA